MPPVTIVGSYLSPYVRKALVVLEHKGVAYRIDPIIPFTGDERFTKLSPLRRVPVLVDGDLALADSSVICQYLEDRFPARPIYPREIAARARARWLEEFADSRMGDVFVWQLFQQLAINPRVFGRPTDRAVVERTLATDIPGVLDYLESLAPEKDFLFGDFSIADLSIATFFRTVEFVRFTIDAARWPRTAGLVGRTLASESFMRLRPFEDRMASVPPAQQRAALAEMGAPLTDDTYATSTLTPSIMLRD